MIRIEADTHELREYAADLTHATDQVVRAAPGIIKHGAMNIKKQLRKEAAQSRSFRSIAATITFDVEDRGFQATVGPEKRGGGNLANIAYFGGVNGGGSTVPDPRGALMTEIPNVESEIGKLLTGNGF